MEIKIEIPEDILSDKDRLKAVEQGIVYAVSKGGIDSPNSYVYNA
jgi:hypothetical protein